MQITEANLLVFDWETSGEKPEYALQPWRVAQGLAWGTSLVGLYRDQGRSVIRGGVLASDALPQREVHLRCTKAANEILTEAADRKMIVGGWNVPFDVAWLIAYGQEKLVKAVQFIDGMLLWRHFYIEPEYEVDRSKKKSYGLKAFVAENFPDKAGYEDDADFHDTSPEARDKLHRYNIRDCIGTYAGIRMVWERLSPEQRTAALIEARCIPMTAAANWRGLPVDYLATRELQAKLHVDADKCLTELAPHGVSEKVVRSPIQLSGLLFDEWGLPVLKENVGKKTKKISRATDKEVLHELSFLDPRAKTLHKYREALGNCTKFADNILTSADYNRDGCVHPLANIFGTYTSRMTYSSKQGKGKEERPIGFAIHQEKGRAEGPMYRAAIKAPLGYDLTEFDASGQEFRWMAIYSGDERMLQLCFPGEDPHSFMAANISHCDYRELVDLVAGGDKAAEMIRKGGKFANLSCQYRTGPKKLLVKARVEYDLPMRLPEATHIWKMYQVTYPGVPVYWKRQIVITRKKGYVETMAGRRVQIRGNWDGPQGWSMESTSINYPIQGTGGDQKYLALACLQGLMTELDVRFGWDLHDGLYFFSPRNRTEKWLAGAKKILDNLPYKQAWGFDPPIPLPFDAKVGGSWGNLKPWKGQ